MCVCVCCLLRLALAVDLNRQILFAVAHKVDSGVTGGIYIAVYATDVNANGKFLSVTCLAVSQGVL